MVKAYSILECLSLKIVAAIPYLLSGHARSPAKTVLDDCLRKYQLRDTFSFWQYVHNGDAQVNSSL